MAETQQAATDRAKLYNPFAWSKRGIEWAKDFPIFCKKAEEAGDKAREALNPTSLAYGPSEEQRIEWFRLDGEARPVFVYVHGGGWRAGDVASSAFMAAPLAKEGIETVVLGYDVCPNVTLTTIVAQVHTGLQTILSNLQPGSRLFVCGVSAGAHLAALLLSSFSGDPRLCGFFLLSGQYDLRPLLELPPSKPLSLTSDNVDTLSPFHRDFQPSSARVVLSVGSDESPALKQQALDLAQKLRSAGWPSVETRVEEGLDHLNMSEVLQEPLSPLMARLLAIMKDE